MNSPGLHVLSEIVSETLDLIASGALDDKSDGEMDESMEMEGDNDTTGSVSTNSGFNTARPEISKRDGSSTIRASHHPKAKARPSRGKDEGTIRAPRSKSSSSSANEPDDLEAEGEMES